VKTDTLPEAIAIGRVYESGKLMAASGTLFDKKRELDCDDLKISTCEITKVCCASFYNILYVWWKQIVTPE
jgi:hypothetical protein